MSASMTPQQFAESRKLGSAAATKAHVNKIRDAIRSRAELDAVGHPRMKERQPVSAAAVTAYGIPLPAGYSKEGDMYVWKPIAKHSAGS